MLCGKYKTCKICIQIHTSFPGRKVTQTVNMSHGLYLRVLSEQLTWKSSGGDATTKRGRLLFKHFRHDWSEKKTEKKLRSISIQFLLLFFFFDFIRYSCKGIVVLVELFLFTSPYNVLLSVHAWGVGLSILRKEVIQQNLFLAVLGWNNN